MTKQTPKEALYKTAEYPRGSGQFVAIENAQPHPRSIGDWVYQIRLGNGDKQTVFGWQMTRFCL